MLVNNEVYKYNSRNNNNKTYAVVVDTCIVAMEEAAPNTTAPDFDVYGAMDWKDGVGTLPGSELKVCDTALPPPKHLADMI